MKGLVSIVALALLAFSCGPSSRKAGALPPDTQAPAPPEVADPAPLPSAPDEQRRCLETQKLALNSLGWDDSQGVLALIDLLLAQSDAESRALPLCRDN